MIVFADFLDDSCALNSEFEHAFGRSFSMQLMTDSKSLFYIIGKGSRTGEKISYLTSTLLDGQIKHKKSRTPISYTQRIISQTDK